MPLTVTLPPYQVVSVLNEDSYFTFYRAVKNDVQYDIMEFMPGYMAQRTDSGELAVSSRFEQEYAQALQKFINRAGDLKYINDVSVPPVEEIIERNNTAYIVRRMCEYPTITTYLGDKHMPCSEAYVFIRPLLVCLIQAERKDLSFAFSEPDLRVNHYHQLIMDTFFTWDVNRGRTIMLVNELFYRLLTGNRYQDTKALPSALGITVPPRVEAVLAEVLNGDALYGSTDDFFKKFKSVMDSEFKQEGDRSKKRMNPTLVKWVLIVMSALVVFTTVYLLIYHVYIPVYNMANPNLANPELLSTPPPAQAVAAEDRNFTAYTMTNPDDPNDILNGAVYESRGSLYYRAWKNGYYLARRGPDGVETVLLHEVRPAFIVVSGDYVYFSDGLSGYKIYRVDIKGGNAVIISQNAALFLQTDGDYLYYTNLDDFNRIYRIDTNTLTDELYAEQTAYDTVANRGVLYYADGGRHFNLYKNEGGELTRLNETPSDNLRMRNNRLYYIDLNDGMIRAVTTEGKPVTLDCPVKAHAFDIAGQWLVIIEAETYRLRGYNLDTGERVMLLNRRAAYAQTADGAVYAAEYDDCRFIRRIELP